MSECETTGAFSSSASTYDQDFTNTLLGRTQRARVWNYLDLILDDHSFSANILEINCGTGEDAIYLASKGHQVLATDDSDEMLSQARNKAKGQLLESINFLHRAIQTIDEITPEKRYDLIFSNFGGLNCLNRDELIQLPKKLKSLLTDDGHIVFVLMPKYCFVEDLYMLFKGQLGNIRRRNKIDGLQVAVGSQTVPAWYYAPKLLSGIFQNENFILQKIRTVGFTPSYLNPYLERRSGVSKLWSTIGGVFRRSHQFSFLADHYLIHFRNTAHKA